jgi:hypothetical protein
MQDALWDPDGEPDPSPEEPTGGGMSLQQLLALMADHGMSRVLVKRLAANDNSKQQVYVGPGFTALNVLPNDGIVAAHSRGRAGMIYYAPLNFSWLGSEGALARVPGAKLILYPQYPEVRFSGFLKGARFRPSAVMTSRQPERVLFFGVRESDGALIGYADTANSLLARQLTGLGPTPSVGVFQVLSVLPAVPVVDWRALLIAELRRVHSAGWITGRRLTAPGAVIACNNRNCGGFTLEAELGIVANASAAPDFHGWEIKAHSNGGAVTVMTEEPKAGYYHTAGFRPFMHRYGYADRSGEVDRINFGGIYKVGLRTPITGLTAVLIGYDAGARTIDMAGRLALVTAGGDEALAFPFVQLIGHWSTKHALCAYVPFVSLTGPPREYSYGPTIRMGTGTDGLRLIAGLAEGRVYYDPSPKLETATGPHPTEHRRSQFRIRPSAIDSLYEHVDEISL